MTHKAGISTEFLHLSKYLPSHFHAVIGVWFTAFHSRECKSPWGTACHQALLGKLQLMPGPLLRSLYPGSSAPPGYTLARARGKSYLIHQLEGQCTSKAWSRRDGLLFHSHEGSPNAITSCFKSWRHRWEPPVQEMPCCFLVEHPHHHSLGPAHQLLGPPAQHSCTSNWANGNIPGKTCAQCYLWSWLWERTV